MEGKEYIKSIKAQGKRGKMYLLSDVKPSILLTGGFWGQADASHVEFVQSLMDRAFDYVSSQSHVTNRDLFTFLKSKASSGMSTKLDDTTLQTIIDTLLIDERMQMS